MTLHTSVRRTAATLILAALVSMIGCHRAQYRQRADAEAYQLIQEKANNPHWELPRYWIEVDPRSRMFDPFNPDLEPMPHDDPASHVFMHDVDKKKGYPHWHANGDTDVVENPDWMAYLSLDENGVLNLNAEEAYQLALVHSRDYQEQFETLYLSALDVSAERFRFDAQLFAGYSAIYNTSGSNLGLDRELTLSTNTAESGRLALPGGGARAPNVGDFILHKGFVTGADLAAGFANSLIWDFRSSNVYMGSSLLDVSLIQPLLRGAGRDRIMEQLTISERTLLGNVRALERYRRQFYVDIMTGSNQQSGVTRRGGFFGAAGLGGFTGVGGGGFGGVGGGGGGGAGAGFGGGGAGAQAAGGYFGLLQNQQDIRNQQVTIAGLRTNLQQLRESLQESLLTIPEDSETIIRERLQIAQARQALLTAESRLLISQADYQNSLDNFKVDLGLPPQLCVNIQDDMFRQFDLIPPESLTAQSQITLLRDEVGNANDAILSQVQQTEVDGVPTQSLPWSDDLAGQLQRLKIGLAKLRQIREQVSSEFMLAARQDIERLKEAVPRRRNELLRLQQKYDRDLSQFQRYGGLDPCQVEFLVDIDPSVFDIERLEQSAPELDAEYERLTNQFQSYVGPIDEIERTLDQLLTAPDKPAGSELLKQLSDQVIFAIPSLLSDLSDDILDLSLVQARARTYSVEVPPVEMSWEVALELARRYRRDWMNNRAALVDSWRLIEFNADDLEGILDLEFRGQLGNRGDSPFEFADSNGQITVGARFDAPITRLQERNTYRQALIEYQQARRQYYEFVDQTTQSLRATLRTLERNRVNFEERRAAVLTAIDQVVLNDQIQKLGEERGQAVGPTAARDVVSALSDLQTAQTDFLDIWVNYEVQRIILDLNLGTMNLDPNGNWIDPGPIGDEYGYPAPMGFDCGDAGYSVPVRTPELLPESSGGEEPPRELPAPPPIAPPEVVVPEVSTIRYEAPAISWPPTANAASFEQVNWAENLDRLPPVSR